MPTADTPGIVALDREGRKLRSTVKVCTGSGLRTLREWLTGDVLFLGDDTGKPLVLMDVDTWQRLARTIARRDMPREDHPAPFGQSNLARVL